MMLMSGIGLLAAAIPLPTAGASPSRPAGPAPAAPPPSSEPPAYIFQDEFDGPAGAGPDPAKWTVQNWHDDVFPPVVGHYRDDRRNVFLDGNSNLVLRATREGDQYFSGKLAGQLARDDQYHLGSADQTRLHDARLAGPRYWAVNEDPDA